MTPEALAALVNARRSGVRRWLARCPAHPDRSPSLSIGEGKDGRVLMRCWAGCATKDILAARGLTMRDLFAGPPVAPQQAVALAAQRNARATVERQQRAADRAARDRVWKLGCIRDALGGKLARSPDDAALGKLFHTVCARFHDAETALFPVAPELGGKRMEPPGEVPGWIDAALADIGKDLQPQKPATQCERAA